MAKPVAPLMSFDAGGQVGKSIVFSKWKGRSYVRRFVVPSNPRSTAQTLTRDAFRTAGSFWLGAPSLFTAPWSLFAQGQVLTNRNAFTGRFVGELRAAIDMAGIVMSPGAKGGLAPTSIALTPGVGQIVVDFTTPTPPTGWTLVSAVAAAILNDDPANPTNTTIVAAEDAVTQAQVTLTGLTSATEYVVGGWLEWTKTDGSTAFGASVNDLATPT